MDISEYSVESLNNSYKSTMEEEQAESIDSGCVPDLTPEQKWNEVGTILDDEYNFVLGLLQHTVFTRKDKKESADRPPTKEESVPTTTVNEVEGPCSQSDKKNKNKEEGRVKNEPSRPLITSMNYNELNAERYKVSVELGRIRNLKVGNLNPFEVKILKKKLEKRIRIIDTRKKKMAKTMKKKIRTEIQELQEMKTGQKNTPGRGRQGARIFEHGRLIFSKFDFSEADRDMYDDKRKKPDLNHYLNLVLKKKEKVIALKQNGNVQEAAKIVDQAGWDNAFKKAAGEKVKDDVNRMKKTMNRKKQKKKNSETEWKERERIVDKRKDDKQERRKRNIAGNRQKKSKKGKKCKAKGNNRVPGF